MKGIVYLVVLLATLHAAHPYILLTANLDDMNVLARQMEQSPVVSQLSNIWRRAQDTFNEQLRRCGGDGAGADGPESQSRRSRNDDDQDAVVLGKMASEYLKSINKLFDKTTN